MNFRIVLLSLAFAAYTVEAQSIFSTRRTADEDSLLLNGDKDKDKDKDGDGGDGGDGGGGDGTESRLSWFLNWLERIIVFYEIVFTRGDFCTGGARKSCSDDPAEYVVCRRGETICTKEANIMRILSLINPDNVACGCCDSADEPTQPTYCAFDIFGDDELNNIFANRTDEGPN